MIYDDDSNIGVHTNGYALHHKQHMSLNNSPDARPGGGWSSPGLGSSEQLNGRRREDGSGGSGKSISWASAKASSARVHNRGNGLFRNSMRRLSESLPFFSFTEKDERTLEKERSRRGHGQLPIAQSWSEVPRRLGLLASRRRKVFAAIVLVILALFWWYYERERDLHHMLPPPELTDLSYSILVSTTPYVRRWREVCHCSWCQ